MSDNRTTVTALNPAPKIRLDVAYDEKAQLSVVRLTIGDQVAEMTTREWSRMISSPGRI